MSFAERQGYFSKGKKIVKFYQTYRKGNIKMEKFKITATQFIKGEFEFNKEQFEIPKILRVDFSKAREKYEYVEINGESTKTDKIERYTVYSKDGELAQFLEEKGMVSEIGELKDFVFEISGDLEKVKMFKDKGLTRYIILTDYAIKPKWNRSRECFDGIKLEVREFEEE